MRYEHHPVDHHPGAIGIVGTGAVARALGRLLFVAGEPVVAVASRTWARAESAAAFIGPTVRPIALVELPAKASRVLIATSDEVIAPAAGALAAGGLRQGVVLHTCGAMGAGSLAPLGALGVACGVLHPLQSVVATEQAPDSFRGVTFGIAGDPAARQWGEAIATLVGGKVAVIAGDRMAAYHAGAAMASNALVAVIDAAVLLMGEAGISAQAALEAIGPLCRTTLDNTLRLGPEAALTGPIARGDPATVALHMTALAAGPSDIAVLYRAVGGRLLDLARRRGLPETSLRALAVALEADHAGEIDEP